MSMLRASELQASHSAFTSVTAHQSNSHNETPQFVHYVSDAELMSALHEAAQAVAAWALSLKVYSVTISPTPATEVNGFLVGIKGHVSRELFATPFDRPSGQQPDMFLLECAILYTGPVAASRLRNGRLANFTPIWPNDITQIASLLDSRGFTTGDAVAAKALKMARKLSIRHFVAIDKVVRALLKHRFLSADDFVKIVEP